LYKRYKAYEAYEAHEAYEKYKAYEKYRRCPMTRLSLSEARSNFAEVVNRVSYGGERIVLGRRGRDMAVLISVEDLKLFDKLLEEYEDRIDVEAAREALAEPGRVPWEKVKADLKL
jgi:prevent-host-death family protein